MKKLIFILAILFAVSCTKQDNAPIEILRVKKGVVVMTIDYEVKRDIDLAIYHQGDFPIHTRVKKGLYTYSGEIRTIVFDYKFGKLIVE